MTFMTFATPYILWFAFVGLPVTPGEPAPAPSLFHQGGRSHDTKHPHFSLHDNLHDIDPKK